MNKRGVVERSTVWRTISRRKDHNWERSGTKKKKKKEF
jgi:hypothetical protein